MKYMQIVSGKVPPLALYVYGMGEGGVWGGEGGVLLAALVLNAESAVCSMLRCLCTG